MEKPDNYVIVTLSGQMDCETISKIRRRMEMEVELERWKIRALAAEAKLDRIRTFVDKHFGGVG